jgi:uncharacterized tellurite resistance protein B-like protein
MFNLILGISLYIFGLWLFFTSTSLIGFAFSIFISINALKMIIDSYEKVKGRKLFDSFSNGASRYSRYSENRNQTNYIQNLRYQFERRNSLDILAAILATLCTHIAKADGNISENEMRTIRNAMDENFANKVDHYFIAEIVKITKNHLVGLGFSNIYLSAVEVAHLYLELVQYLPAEEREELILLLFTNLYEVTLADGIFSKEKEAMFSAILQRFGASEDYVEMIRRTAHYKFNRKNYSGNHYATPQSKVENARKLFGLNESFTKEELDKSWKKMALNYHPDRYHNQGEEIYKLMNQKFLEAKEAYDILNDYIKK